MENGVKVCKEGVFDGSGGCVGVNCVGCGGSGGSSVTSIMVGGRVESAACLASGSALLLPCVIGEELIWWDLQWAITILVGSKEA